MSSMVKSLAYPCFWKMFFKMAFLNYFHNNQTIRQPPAPQGSVLDRARALPEDLRAVMATSKTVMKMKVAKPLFLQRLVPMETSPREWYHSAPIPKQP